MTDWRSIDDPEQAIGALFTEVLETAWPADWTEGVSPRPGAAEPPRSEPLRPPVIRLSPDRHASIDGRPDLTVIPTVPAAPREVVEPGRWSRHRISVAQVAAVVVMLAGLGWGGRLVLDRVDGGPVDADASGELVAASDATTSAALVATASTASPPATSGVPEPAPPPSSAATAPAVSTTETSTPTTVATTQATTAPTTAAPPTTAPTTAAPPTTAPTTAAPPTTAPTTAAPPTTAPTTTAPPTTVPSTEPAPTTTEPATTTEPSPADVRIRNLAVSDVTATSAVVSFTTADCAAVAYDVSRGAGRGARGVPGGDECWTQHSIVIGAAEPLRPDTRYTVTVATFGRDGASDKASIRFRTLEQKRPADDDGEEDDD